MKDDNGINILPTGECFEDCTWKFTQMLRDPKHRDNPRFFLVHGICLMSNGEPYSHAWLELDGRAIQSGIREDTREKVAVVMEIEEYHKRMRVQEFTRYSWLDVIRTAMAHNDEPPPWEERYKALTREGKARARMNKRKR